MSSKLDDRAARQRPTAAAALLLHLLVALLLPLVGWAHEVPNASQPIHIEEEGGSSSCPRAHDDLHCITCRLAATAFLLTTGTRCADSAAPIRHAPARLSGVLAPARLQTSPPSSRAPPAL